MKALTWPPGAISPSLACVGDANSKRQRKVTMAEVAAAAGVSPTTVSHALRGLGRVDPATRQHVVEIAESLGYHPDPRARALRRGHSNMLAVASSMHPAVSLGAARLGFYMDLAAVVVQSAFDAGYGVVLLPPMSPDHLHTLKDLDVDGVVVVEPSAGDPIVTELDALRLPYVTMGLQRTGDDPAATHAVDFNATAAAELMLGHLAERGARNALLMVGDRRRPSYDASRTVYQKLAERHGWTAGIEVVSEGDGEQGGYHRMLEVLDRPGPPIDAVAAVVDAFAVGVVRAVAERGLVVPGDVMVVTRYDGLRARACVPPLTALDLRLDSAGDAAVRLLLSLLQQGDAGTGEIPTLPAPRLIARESTAR